MATLLPTYDSIIVPYTQGSDLPGQVSNWIVHGSYATDRYGWTIPSGAPAAGQRYQKVSGPGSVDEWWYLMSFIFPDAADWPAGTGGYIKNWHNTDGDLGMGNTYNGVTDTSDPVSCIALGYHGPKVETTLAQPYAVGQSVMHLTNAAGFRSAAATFYGAYIGSPQAKNHITWTAKSGNDLTGVACAGSWPAGTVVHALDGGLVFHLEQDGDVQWTLPDPVPGVRYDLTLHVIFGRNDGSTVRPGLAELWVQGSDTKIVDRRNANILQRTLNYYKTPGQPYTQQWVDFWDGGPYRGKPPGNPPVLFTESQKHRFTATRMGNTLSEAIADVPVFFPPAGRFFITHGTLTDANGVTHYGTQNNHIPGYPDFGPTRMNEDYSGGVLIPYSVPKLTAEAFQLPPSLGGSGSPPTVPTLVAAPTISGTARPGNTLTATQGSWSGSPTSYIFQWQFTYDRVRPFALTGETAATLALTANHTGLLVRCQVTATNAAGSATAWTAWSAEVDNGTANSWAPNGGFETNINLWAGNQGTETVTQDGTWSHTGTKSIKVVTPGTQGFEGIASPPGQGIFCPAGQTKQLTLRLKATNLASVRVSVPTYDPADKLVRTSAQLIATNNTDQAVTIAVPAPAVDSYQKILITTGSLPAQAITINADDVTLDNAASPAGRPTFVDATGPHKANAGSLTFSRTVPAGSNRALAVIVSYDDRARDVSLVTPPTFNGVAFTRVAKPSPTAGGNVEVWVLVAPTVGTFNVIVTNTNTVQYVVGTMLFTDVDQTTPTGTPAYGIGTTGSPSVTFSSSQSEYVVGGVSVGSNGGETLAALAGQTDQWNSRQYTTYGCRGAGAIVLGDASVTVGWTLSGATNQPWAVAAIGVRGIAGGAAPANTAIPLITGTAAKGQTLSLSDGSWSNSPTAYGYQWYRETGVGTGAYEAIPSGTDRTYTPIDTDLGLRIKADVAASNANGVTVATATAVGPVTGIAPTLVTAPTVFGPNTIGATLAVDTGVWNDNPTSFTYQWQRDTGSGFADVGGATAVTYPVVAADDNATFRVHVTATNASGPTVATSSSSGVIGPAGKLDVFNRANETPLASPWAGPIENGVGTLNLNGYTIRSAAAGGTSAQAYRTDISTVDTYAEFDAKAVPAAAGQGIASWGRVQNPGNTSTMRAYLFAYLTGSGYRLYVVTAGHTYTPLGAFVATHTHAAGEGLRLEVVGSVITGFYRDAGGLLHLVVQAVDSTITGAGTVGIETNGTDGRLDNFDVGPVTMQKSRLLLGVGS